MTNASFKVFVVAIERGDKRRLSVTLTRARLIKHGYKRYFFPAYFLIRYPISEISDKGLSWMSKLFIKSQEPLIRGWIFIVVVSKYGNLTRRRSALLISELHFST